MNELRELPVRIEEPRAAERSRLAARAAFQRSTAPPAWHAPLGRVTSVMMPAALAAFVGLYLMWAFASATALLR